MPRRQSSTQHQKFIDKARELGVDEDEAAFDEKLRRIAEAKREEDSPQDDDR